MKPTRGTDAAYLARRSEQEREAAELARSPQARLAHLELAARLSLAAEHARRDEGMPPGAAAIAGS